MKEGNHKGKSAESMNFRNATVWNSLGHSLSFLNSQLLLPVPSPSQFQQFLSTTGSYFLRCAVSSCSSSSVHSQVSRWGGSGSRVFMMTMMTTMMLIQHWLSTWSCTRLMTELCTNCLTESSDWCDKIGSITSSLLKRRETKA